MNEQTRQRTEAQAEASRRNGKKGGVKSPEGKRRSSENAVKHGLWARRLKLLETGPLQEDPVEYGAFVAGFIQELKPGDHVVLHQLALDVADKAWKVSRAQRWETYGFSRSESPTSVGGHADWLLTLAAKDRDAADVVRKLPDPSIPLDDLCDALATLHSHLDGDDAQLHAMEDADTPEIANAIAALIRSHFGNPEQATELLESAAEDTTAEANQLLVAGLPDAARAAIDSGFARNAERLVTHVSRELDRSLKRYWTLWERMQMIQAPPQAQMDPGPEGSPEDPSLESPNGPDPRTSPDAASRATSDEPLDVSWLLSLLDQFLASSTGDGGPGQTPEHPTSD